MIQDKELKNFDLEAKIGAILDEHDLSDEDKVRAFCKKYSLPVYEIQEFLEGMVLEEDMYKYILQQLKLGGEA